jgi:hypothetical protein
MKPAAIALMLSLLFGLAAPAVLAADQPGSPQISAERVAMMLERLHVPALSDVITVGGSCATSCGPGPEGSCTKSCSGSQSCSAACSGGKAVCSCQ